MRGRRVALTAAALAAAVGVMGVAQLAFAAAPKPKQRFSGFPGGPYFVVSCSSTHRNNDDPIVFPGQPGKSHNHTFVGNRSANAFSTPASLRDPADARCGPKTDGSAYWFPTLYANGNAVRPHISIIYYVRLTDRVQPFPAGLKVIAGNARATRPQAARIASFSCGPPDGTRLFAAPPNCPEGQFLHMNVNFPDCWDGRRLDSPDHQSHMAYSASGRYSLHGDFINAWDQSALAELVRRMNY